MGKTTRAIRDQIADQPRGAGRPPIPVDWDHVAELLRLSLSLADVAGIYRCHEDTLVNHARECGVDISALREQKRAQRRQQVMERLEGHAKTWGPAAIFEAKNLCNWRDEPKPPASTREVVRIEVVLVPRAEHHQAGQVVEGQARVLAAPAPEADLTEQV